MWKKVWGSSFVRLVREMVDIYFKKRILSSAAELAYFLILSFFPILICVNAFVGVLQVDPGAVVRGLEPFLPGAMLGVVREYLGYVVLNESPALLAAGIAMTLFSASGALRALMRAIGNIYECKRYQGWWAIVSSVLFSLVLLVVLYFSMVVVLTGNWFFHLLPQILPFELPVLGGWNWQWRRFILLFGVVLVMVLVVYRMGTPKENGRAPVFLGALVASAALVGASALFSWLIGMSSQYSLVYGSLASIMIMLLWLFLCGNVLILGSALNYVRSRRKNLKKTEKNT